MDPRTDHQWPTDPAAHVWTSWKNKTGVGGPTPPTQSRMCIDPACGAHETRETPKA